MNYNLPHSATHSSLDLFDKLTILDPIITSNVQECLCQSSSDESSVEFNFQSDLNNFIDLQEIYLKVTVHFKKPLEFGHAKPELNKSKDKHDETTFVNNLMHSLFKNAELCFNGTQVYSSNDLYAHKAFISNEISHTSGTKTSLLGCQGYGYEKMPSKLDSEPFVDRHEKLDDQTSMTFFGKLAIDVFTCDKYLLPGVKVNVRLSRSDTNFVVIRDEDHPTNVYPVITDIKLFVRKVAVHESTIRHIEATLSKDVATYNFSEVLPKYFSIASGLNQFKVENIFNNAPIRRLVLAMNTSAAFRGSNLGTNPFHYQKFGLERIKLVRGTQVVVDLDTTDNTEAFVTTIRALKFDEDGPGVEFQDFDNHFILAFDLTSTQEAHVHMYFRELLAAPLRLELQFKQALEKVVDVLVLGERLSTIAIDKHRAVHKNG